MSKGTGIKGYTPDRLRRSKDARERQDARDQRTAEEQLYLIATRPGKSAKERRNLMRAVDYA